MFTQRSFTTLGAQAEVTDHTLKPELDRKNRTGYKASLKVLYMARVVPYPNEAMHIVTHDDEQRGIQTIKRTFLTEGRVVFIHLEERQLTVREVEGEKIKTVGGLLTSRLLQSKRVPDHEFQLMLSPQLEPYFAR